MTTSNIHPAYRKTPDAPTHARIDTQGVSNYYINEKRVTFSEYKGVLADENIIIDAKNFMVFQVITPLICLRSGKIMIFLTLR